LGEGALERLEPIPGRRKALRKRVALVRRGARRRTSVESPPLQLSRRRAAPCRLLLRLRELGEKLRRRSRRRLALHRQPPRAAPGGARAARPRFADGRAPASPAPGCRRRPRAPPRPGPAPRAHARASPRPRAARARRRRAGRPPPRAARRAPPGPAPRRAPAAS